MLLHEKYVTFVTIFGIEIIILCIQLRLPVFLRFFAVCSCTQNACNFFILQLFYKERKTIKHSISCFGTASPIRGGICKTIVFVGPETNSAERSVALIVSSTGKTIKVSKKGEGHSFAEYSEATVQKRSSRFTWNKRSVIRGSVDCAGVGKEKKLIKIPSQQKCLQAEETICGIISSLAKRYITGKVQRTPWGGWKKEGDGKPHE